MLFEGQLEGGRTLCGAGNQEKGTGGTGSREERKEKETGGDNLRTQSKLVVVVAVAGPRAPATKLVSEVVVAFVVVVALGDETGEAARFGGGVEKSVPLSRFFGRVE